MKSCDIFCSEELTVQPQISQLTADGTACGGATGATTGATTGAGIEDAGAWGGV